MIQIIIWPAAFRWDEDAICAGWFWHAALHASTCFSWSVRFQNIILFVFMYVAHEEIRIFALRTLISISLFLLAHVFPRLSRQLLHFSSFLPHKSSLSLCLSLYLWICGRDELTICCSGRAWKGLEGERGSQTGRDGWEGEALCVNCDGSQNRTELKFWEVTGCEGW